PVMSRSTYNHLIERKSVNVLRPGKGLGSYALIEYASLPERFKIRFVEKYGNPEEIMKKENVGLPQDQEAQRFFYNHILPNGEHIPESKQQEYTINARVLSALLDMFNTQKAMRRACNNNTPVIWANIFKASEDLRDAYHHTLPKSEARLRCKLREYSKEGYACLISGKFGNSNTIKITKAGERQIIALRRSKTPVYTISQMFDEYNAIARKKGWKELKSENSLRQFLERPEIKPQWYDAVYGELASKQLYSRHNKTLMPSMRDSLWYGDGTKLNLFYKDYEGGKLVVKTAFVYEVSDSFNDTLLGYAIGRTETFDLQYRAFRMAIETSGHKPYEITTDNQGGQTSKIAKDFFASIVSHVSRTTAPYNPQSKTIERLFGEFQRQILGRDWRFTGGNISAKEAWKVNREFIEANKESLYTYEELVAAYDEARKKWNAMEDRMAAYQASVNPESEAVSDIDMIELFWIRTDRPSRFTADGITIQYQKRKYTYEVLTEEGTPDYEWRKSNTGKEFIVKFDPMKMDVALLFEQTATGLRYAATAYPYLTVHRNIQEQKEGDAALIRLNDTENKRMRVQRRIENHALEMEHGVAPEQNGLRTPVLKGISEDEFEALADTIVVTASPVETVDIGPFNKELSNTDYNPLDALSRL
ncbi:MAG: kinase, partial [Candidatus Cryptobacteroides sp.]